MNAPIFFAAATANANKAELVYVWEQATPEAKVIIFCLIAFSIVAWSVMIGKAVQMRRAKKLNHFFNTEFRTQKSVLDVYDRRVQADGCPLFMVYQAGSLELDARLKNPDGPDAQAFRLPQRHGACQTLAGKHRRPGIAEAGIRPDPAGHRGQRRAVSGLAGHRLGRHEHLRPYRQQGSATLTAMAPGVAAALITTVAGLLVAIPSMFGYNWLVHNLRVLTVELDNFAQELVSKMETEYLEEN